jgi:hypothetical protein
MLLEFVLWIGGALATGVVVYGLLLGPWVRNQRVARQGGLLFLCRLFMAASWFLWIISTTSSPADMDHRLSVSQYMTWFVLNVIYSTYYMWARSQLPKPTPRHRRSPMSRCGRLNLKERR